MDRTQGTFNLKLSKYNGYWISHIKEWWWAFPPQPEQQNKTQGCFRKNPTFLGLQAPVLEEALNLQMVLPKWFISIILELIQSLNRDRQLCWGWALLVPCTPIPTPSRIQEGGGTADWDAGAMPGEGMDPDNSSRDKNRSSRPRTAVSSLNCQFLISCFALWKAFFCHFINRRRGQGSIIGTSPTLSLLLSRSSIFPGCHHIQGFQQHKVTARKTEVCHLVCQDIWHKHYVQLNISSRLPRHAHFGLILRQFLKWWWRIMPCTSAALEKKNHLSSLNLSFKLSQFGSSVVYWICDLEGFTNSDIFIYLSTCKCCHSPWVVAEPPTPNTAPWCNSSAGRQHSPNIRNASTQQ